MFTSILEAPEAEVARLAQSPVGSTNHALSQMPVNIRQHVQDLMIQVPHFEDDPKYTIVVVPFESHPYAAEDPDALPRRRHNRSWTCIVIASDHPSYPVGSWRVTFPEYQLVRGTLRTLLL